MYAITPEQATAVMGQMNQHVLHTYDLAVDPLEIPLYHTQPHTLRVGTTVAHFAKQMGVYDITDCWTAQIAASSHDADLFEYAGVLTDSPHPDFAHRRVRNMSGDAEDASADRVATACRAVGISESVIAAIKAADAATTVAFTDGVLLQPRLTESGNPALNFLLAKADIAHQIPMQDKQEKGNIVLRLWLEQYPAATAKLLNGTFTITTDEEFRWISNDLWAFLGPIQQKFAKSQHERIFEDAELCRLPYKALLELQNIFSVAVQKKHLNAMAELANRVPASRINIVRALQGSVYALRQKRAHHGLNTAL